MEPIAALENAVPAHVSPLLAVDRIAADISRSANESIAQHLQVESNELVRKKKRILHSDAEKIESLFNRIDAMKRCSILLKDVLTYVETLREKRMQFHRQ